MGKIIKFLMRKRVHSDTSTRTEILSPVSQKAQAGIDYTIKNYGKALKDLARYDRGEEFSR